LKKFIQDSLQLIGDFRLHECRKVVAVGVHLWDVASNTRFHLRRFLSDDAFGREVRPVIDRDTLCEYLPRSAA
jgi:hypothetical protein